MRGVCSSRRWSWVEKMNVRPRRAVQVAHQVDELSRVACIEIGGGFVSEDQRGTVHDGTGDGYALTFSAESRSGR